MSYLTYILTVALIITVFSSSLIQVDALKSPCPRARYIATNLDFQGKLCFICLQDNHLSVISMLDQRVLLNEQVQYYGQPKLSSFVDDEGTFRILLADSSKLNGTSMYAISRFGRYLGQTHTVNSQFVSAITTWKLNLNLEWQLATANQPILGSAQRTPIIEIYSWRLSYFDSYQTINLPVGITVSKLEPMNLFGQEYLIVATDVDSLIYKLDFSDGSLTWIYYQSLGVTFGLDVRSFEIYHQGSPMKDYYFIMLANAENEMIIYKYFGDKFVKTKSTPIPGATRLDTISYGVGDSYVVIAVLVRGNINLYLFDGIEIKVLPNPNSNRIANFHLFAPPAIEEGNAKRTLTEPQLLLATSKENYNTDEDPPDQQELYQISVGDAIKEDESYSKRNYVPEDLLSWCKQKINSILGDNFDSIAKKLEQLPRVDQNYPIILPPGDLIVDDLLVSNLLIADNIVEIGSIQPILINDSSYEIFEQIERVHREIDPLKYQVDQILVDDGTVQEIHRPLQFDTFVIESFSPQIGELETVILNNRNISDLSVKALLTGRALAIRQDIRFEHLVLAGRTSILDTLNGLHIDDIVFKRGPARDIIYGEKVFLNGLYTSSNIRVDHWNGVEFGSAANSFLTTKDQFVTAQLHFNQIIIDTSREAIIGNETPRIETLNGYNLDNHLEQIAIANQDNRFDVPIEFEELILNSPIQMNPGSLLSSLDIDDLWLNAMFKQSNQNVTAPFEFADDVRVSLGGDIIVDGPVNGIIMNPDTILMTNRDFVLLNPIIFDQNVYVREAVFHGALNGIEMVENPITGLKEFPILLNIGNQTITGDKVLTEVYLDGQSNVNNINGVLDLGHLYSLVLGTNQTYRFNNIRLFGQNIRIADNAFTSFNSTVNGYPIGQICSLAERITNHQNATYNRLKFDQPINMKSLYCGTINGFNSLSNSFLTRFGSQRIAGTLKLVNGAIFNTTIGIQQSLNNLNTSPLSRAVAQAVIETRTGVKEVRGDLFLEDLVAERINGLRLSDMFIAKADVPQTVRAKMIFDHLDIENVLVVGKNLIANTFNELNITDIIKNTLQYDAPQVIYNHFELNTLHLLPNSNLVVPTLNGINLKRLYADTVFIDSPQQILATKTFRSPVIFEDRVLSRYGIDDLTSEELRFNLLLHGDDLIDGDLEFNNEVIVRKELLIETNNINDIDVKLFVESLLTENQSNKDLRVAGAGSMRFKDVIVNNLVAGGTIQGIDFPRDVIYRADNLNGTYNARLRELQVVKNNQRLINSLYGPGSSFHVLSKYQGQDHRGTCYVHSCARVNMLNTFRPEAQQTQYLLPPIPSPIPLQLQPQLPPQPLPQAELLPQPHLLMHPQPQYQPQLIFQPQLQLRPHLQFEPQLQFQPQTQLQPQPQFGPQPQLQLQAPQPPLQLQPKLQMQTQIPLQPQFTVEPQLYIMPQSQLQLPPLSHPLYMNQSKLMEYRSYQQSIAIRELAKNINRFLSVSLYYEIATTHPLLGPLMHSALSPVVDGVYKSHLFLKATGPHGEPCLLKDQAIDVMEESVAPITKPIFRQNSRIQETSYPVAVDSIVISSNQYLFVLDKNIDQNTKKGISQVIVFFWDYRSGMYELFQKIPVALLTTKMKAFVTGNLGCVAILNPKGGSIGEPTLYCQDKPNSLFNNRIIINIERVADMDIITADKNTQIVIASLSHKNAQNIGDLNIYSFDMISRQLLNIASRKLVKPLRLHFFINQIKSSFQLVVSEAITSNDDTQALTRIFTLRILSGFSASRIHSNTTLFYESQILIENQINDIQTVSLNPGNPLIFLQSAHSISIYAPSLNYKTAQSDCDSQYSLVHRLATKGANRFLVFNEGHNGTMTNLNKPFGHYVVLSKDNCEEQQFATVVLRAKFA